MKKAIIFDFWGTIVQNGIYSPLKQIKLALRLDDIEFSEFVVRLENTMMTRGFESLAEAFKAVCGEFNVECNDGLIERLVGLWNKNWLLAMPFPEAIEVLSKLKEKFKLGLISNTDGFSVEKVMEKFGLGQYFDLILLSYKEGMVKTDNEFYQKVFEGLGVTADECVAVGDSIESDVVAARNANVEVFLVDRKGRRDFENKILNLRELLNRFKIVE